VSCTSFGKGAKFIEQRGLFTNRNRNVRKWEEEVGDKPRPGLKRRRPLQTDGELDFSEQKDWWKEESRESLSLQPKRMLGRPKRNSAPWRERRKETLKIIKDGTQKTAKKESPMRGGIIERCFNVVQSCQTNTGTKEREKANSTRRGKKRKKPTERRNGDRASVSDNHWLLEVEGAVLSLSG